MQPFDVFGKSGAAGFGLEAGMPLGFQHFDLVAQFGLEVIRK